MMPQLLFTDSTRCIDLVTEYKKWYLGELLDGEKRIELRFGFGEAFKVRAVDKENNAVDLREIVAPKAAG